MQALLSRVLLSGLAAGLLSNLPLAQNTWNVPGHSATVQGGLDLASDGDTVLVAPGTYAASYLDFAGKAITLRSQAGPDVTTLTGNDGTRQFWFDDGEGLDTLVQGFEIRAGYASSGAAAYLSNSAATFIDCAFRDNEATTGSHGGVFFLTSGSQLVLERCTFEGNDAGNGYNGSNGSNGADGTFTSGKGKPGGDGWDGGDGGHAGALYAQSNTIVQASNCIFAGNTPGSGGKGGKGGKGGDGFALSAGGDGGDGGDGGNAGQATLYSLGTVELVNCTLLENPRGLGGLYGAGGGGGSGAFTNGTPGSWGWSGSPTSYCGVYAMWPLGLVENSLLWNSDANETLGCTVRYSDVQGGEAYGGSFDGTNIALAPDLTGYVPNASSPLVDAADASLLVSSPMDALGYARIFDDPVVVGVSALDIGAAEWSQGYVLPHGCGLNPAGSLVQMSGTGSLGTMLTLGVHDPTGSMTPAASLSFLTLSVSPGVQPCGVLLPGFGMAGGIGALVVDPASQIMLPPGPLWIGAPAAFLLPLPSAPVLAGKSLHFQGALYDLTSGAIGLTEGKRVLLGK